MNVPEAAPQSLPEPIEHKIARLAEYGFMGITTRKPGIPYAKYHPAPFRDTDRRPIAKIHYYHLQTTLGPHGAHVYIDNELAGHREQLAPDEIEDAWVDHPLKQFLPLDNQVTMRIGTAPIRGGALLLRWADRAIEFDNMQRLHRIIHPLHPHIAVIDAYDISRTNGKMTIEQAREAKRNAARFLLSRIGTTSALITMRLGGNHDGLQPITIRPPRHANHAPFLHIEGVNVPDRTTDDALLTLHEQCVQEWHQPYAGHQLDMPLTTFEADTAFVSAIHD